MNTPNTSEVKLGQKLDIPSFKVSARDYKTPVLSFVNGKPIFCIEDIKNLNSIVIENRKVIISLSEPFNAPFMSEIDSQDGFITKMRLIAQIRTALRNSYRQLNSFPCKLESGSKNTYELTYPIGCLHIESVYYNSETNIVTPKINGNPTVRANPRLPFD